MKCSTLLLIWYWFKFVVFFSLIDISKKKNNNNRYFNYRMNNIYQYQLHLSTNIVHISIAGSQNDLFCNAYEIQVL